MPPVDLFYYSPALRAYLIREGGAWSAFGPKDRDRLFEYIQHRAILFPDDAAELDKLVPEKIATYLRPLAAPGEPGTRNQEPRFRMPQTLDLDELGL